MLWCTPANTLPGHKPTQTSGVIRPLSPDRVNVLNLVVDPKQPSRAKLPMVAGSLPGTRLSTGEGEDDDGVVGETPPGGPLEAAGAEVKDCAGGFPEDGPEGAGPFPEDGPEGAGPFPEVGPGEPSEPPADSEGGGTELPAGPEAELSGELGGVAIGVGTEPSPCVLGPTTELSEVGELPPSPPSASVELGAGAMAELGATDSVAGRPDAELDGETTRP